jgi:hypothetical protein
VDVAQRSGLAIQHHAPLGTQEQLLVRANKLRIQRVLLKPVVHKLVGSGQHLRCTIEHQIVFRTLALKVVLDVAAVVVLVSASVDQHIDMHGVPMRQELRMVNAAATPKQGKFGQSHANRSGNACWRC